MSVTGIASSILTAISGNQGHQTRAQQIQSEFQQLGQDLQSGNLNQAQADFTTLSQNLPGLSQNSGSAAAATTSPNGTTAQAFAQLGQDLQSGNLRASQQDFTAVQQDLTQNAGQQVQGHRHHHHHAESSQDSSSSSSQQTNAINQALGQLGQTLQAGNPQGAQSAFSALLNDLQQIGGMVTPGSSSTAASPVTGTLNVTA